MIKKLVYCIVIAVTVLGLGFIYLTKPYLKREYVRTNSELETIEVEYFNITGDPLCTKLYKVENGEITMKGVFPRVPDDIPDPHEVPQIIEGTRLELNGFLYEWRETNILTSNVKARPVQVMDIVSWNAEVNSEKFQYFTKDDITRPENFYEKNYTNCR